MLSIPSIAAEAPAEPQARKQRWLRALRPFLVTALGFALTAWLVPAMTRQWDDRQKEHDLKAGVVSDMTSVTAHALVDGEAIWSGERLTARARRRMADQWSLSALELESKLGTYFPASVVRSWEVYAWAVDRFIDGQSVSASAALHDAVAAGIPFDRGVGDAVAQLLARSDWTADAVPNFHVERSSPTHISDAENLAQLRKMLRPQIAAYEAHVGLSTWTALEKALLGVEQAVAAQVLRSHAAGFSTSGHDLLHDLLP